MTKLAFEGVVQIALATNWQPQGVISLGSKGSAGWCTTGYSRPDMFPICLLLFDAVGLNDRPPPLRLGLLQASECFRRLLIARRNL